MSQKENEIERPELIPGEYYWYMAEDKGVHFLRQCKLNGMYSNGRCVVTVKSWIGGPPVGGGPRAWTETLSKDQLFYTKDAALFYYLKQVEETILMNTADYEREDQERAALYTANSGTSGKIVMLVNDTPGLIAINDAETRRTYFRMETDHGNR